MYIQTYISNLKRVERLESSRNYMNYTTNRQLNVAKNNTYRFVITNRVQLSLQIQNTPLTSVSLTQAPFPTQRMDLNVPNNKLELSPLNMRFLVSEHLTEWITLYKWMIDLATREGSHINHVETGELTILDGENQEILRIVYRGLWPMLVGDLQYSTNDDEQTLVSDVSFSFDSFSIENVKTGEIIQYGEDQ